ncbi:hypothetical protein IKE98_00070 [Candidatus Saccharibacteria bacterium]|nr:hypothetical protein [Candidatus Saccharibacteria bacterium]
MDKKEKAIIELEKYYFKVKIEPRIAAPDMADMIGVLIGLKPAMMGDFVEKEYEKLKISDFDRLLRNLGLKAVYFRHSFNYGDEMVSYEYFCISKKRRLAKRTKKAFEKLWSLLDENGETSYRKKWMKITKKIGKLLGYPKTAVLDFVRDTDVENEERRARMERNRYYAHSAEHEEEEFKAYDLVLNKAISLYAPKTAEVLTKNPKKRWLD